MIDGDTIDVDVDLGFDVHHFRRLRLYGINTPELHAKDAAVRERAHAAKVWLIDALSKGDLVVRTHKDKTEKYGRMLAELFVGGAPTSLNDQILAIGLAVPFMTDDAA